MNRCIKDIYITYEQKQKAKKKRLLLYLQLSWIIWSMLFIPIIMMALSTMFYGFLLLAIGLYIEAYVSAKYLKIDWKPKYRAVS